MDEITTWDIVFRKSGKTPNLIFLLLYWYLFNKSDFQTNVAKQFEKLAELEEFHDVIPRSLTTASNVTKYLIEMEKYNLVGIKKVENKRIYYQALSFFYTDPFCIKTPHLRGKETRDHYEEYRKIIQDLHIDQHPYWDEEGDFFPFNVKVDTSVVPAQEIVPYYFPDPKEFMAPFASVQKKNYLALYRLILTIYEDMYYNHLRRLDSQPVHQLSSLIRETKIVEFAEAGGAWHPILNVEFARQPSESEIHEREMIEKYLPLLHSSIYGIMDIIDMCLLPIYEHFELGSLCFNKETLKFEEV